MKERFKKISKGLLIIVFSLVGMWEYMQLYFSFDLPQVIVLMPVFGCLAAVFLKKISFVVPIVTIVISSVYQMVENRVSAAGIAESSKINIILNILPVIIIFMMLGIAAGFLVRVLIDRKKSMAVGIICCVLGIVLAFGSGIVMFHNPLYPFFARNALDRYAAKYDREDYPVSETVIFYSMEELEYGAKVIMSDGVVYALYHDRETGEVYEVGNGS
ncbi:MAG: hypothetical protein NC293_06020 [Roseburia sp.]|nr:hypothetical protein [Roseburia sp.]